MKDSVSSTKRNLINLKNIREFLDVSAKAPEELRTTSVGLETYMIGWIGLVHAGTQVGNASKNNIGYVLSGQIKVRGICGDELVVGSVRRLSCWLVLLRGLRGKSQLDAMLESYFESIKDGSDADAIRDGSVALYDEGLGKAGLMRIIEEQLCEDKREEVAEALSKAKNKACEPVSGVGGWLALFCVILIVISPARNIIALLKNVNSAQVENMEVIVSISQIVGMSVFSVFSGISLMTKKSYAVKLAKFT